MQPHTCFASLAYPGGVGATLAEPLNEVGGCCRLPGTEPGVALSIWDRLWGVLRKLGRENCLVRREAGVWGVLPLWSEGESCSGCACVGGVRLREDVGSSRGGWGGV